MIGMIPEYEDFNRWQEMDGKPHVTVEEFCKGYGLSEKLVREEIERKRIAKIKANIFEYLNVEELLK